jgi:hypothetical protein
MSNFAPNNKIYSENQTVPTQLEYPILGAAGAGARGRDNVSFYRSGQSSIEELLNTTSVGGNLGNDRVLDSTTPIQIDPDEKNEILGIPSFLSYPSDLGKNRRFHHFIVFNIYQGESDQTRIQNRKTAIDDAVYNLNDAGVPIDLSAGRLQQIIGGEGGPQLTADQVLRSPTPNTVADANQNPRNFNQRGASGRLLNKSREENAILLANRRFNTANIKSKDTICLYMPQKFTINDQLIYSEEDMGTTKLLYDAVTGKRGSAGALVEKVGRKTVAEMVSRLGEGTGSLLNEGGNVLPGLGALGAAVNELAQETNILAARALTTRQISNPRKEMMFRDVGLRTHSFSFDFMPRNEKEAETALNIIRMLRYHAYPGLAKSGHFFTFPAEFDLTFYTILGDSGMVTVNDNLPKLPKLALQSVSVDFSAAGDFKTFTDAKPAFIRIELGFQEMEQLTNEHIVRGY